MLHSIIMAIIGGALIGSAASLLFLGVGKIAGISGVVGSLLRSGDDEKQWRILFLLGLLLGGVVLVFVAPSSIMAPNARSLAAVAFAGLLVGFGTRMGNGCTSGHGVCGLSRFSKRSLVATLSFMATGFATASLVHLFSGSAL